MYIVNYLLLYVLKKCWCTLPEDDDSSETCRSSVIEKYIDCEIVHLLVLPKF